MAPTATRDLTSCCSPTPTSLFPPSTTDAARPASSPTSLFRIDMHTHIMPPTLPDLSSFSSSPSPSSSSSSSSTSTTPGPNPKPPYPWPTLRPAPDHATTGAVDMYVGPTFFRRVPPSCYDPAARLRDMDAAGVDVQVLSTVPVLFCYDAPVEGAARLARALNDHIGRVVSAGAAGEGWGRFVGLMTVPLQDCAEAVREVRRVRRVWGAGMAGVQIGTSAEGRDGDGVTMMLDDERLEGFWDVCEELDVPVFVHPLGYALSRENPARWGRYWGSWLVGMPCETALAMHALTSSGVLVRHPRLRLCFAHGGGAFPALLGRIQHGFDCRPDLVATRACGMAPTEHFRGVVPGVERGLGPQIWIDSLVHDPDLMEYVLRKLGPGGAERVVLGSDYPFPLGEVPVAGKMLIEDERLGRFMSWEQRAAILARNAIRFLRLGKEFEDRFEERWKAFQSARSSMIVDGEGKNGGWEWTHRDSGVELDGVLNAGGFGGGRDRIMDDDSQPSPTDSGVCSSRSSL